MPASIDRPELEHLEPRLLLSASPVATDETAWQPEARITGSVVASYPSAELAPNVAQSLPLVNMQAFRADPRFAGAAGTGYSVVVIDSGIDPRHPFFGPDTTGNGVADRIVYQWNYVGNNANATDGNGHGSHVSSIIGSSYPGYLGVAPDVNLIALRVLNDSGSGSWTSVQQALQWSAANAAAYNIVSVNLSLGDGQNHKSPVSLYNLGAPLAALADMGVAVVAAAGNDFKAYNSVQGLNYPAADPSAISVGAVYDADIGRVEYGSGATALTTGPDRITPFSQRHKDMLDLFAPGAAITGAGSNGSVLIMHGTSQAAPHVAGMVALAQQVADTHLGRRLTLDELGTLLAETGVTINDGDDEHDNVRNTRLNFPRVDMLALAEGILLLAGPAPAALVTYDGLDVLATDLPPGSQDPRVLEPAMVDAEPSYRTFTIHNLGAADLLLGPVTITGAAFQLVQAPGSLVPAGGQTTFTIEMTTAVGGVKAATIAFATNDPQYELFGFEVTGAVHFGSHFVTAVEANDGQDLPGTLDSLLLTLRPEVDAAGAGLWLQDRSTGDLVDLTAAGQSWDASAGTLRVDLSSVAVAPGHYRAILPPAGLVDEAGQPLVGADSWQFDLTVYLPGDANLDGSVNLLDLAVLSYHWQHDGVSWQEGDFNGDGSVGDDDLALLATYWTQSLPEPLDDELLAAALPGEAELAGEDDGQTLEALGPAQPARRPARPARPGRPMRHEMPQISLLALELPLPALGRRVS